MDGGGRFRGVPGNPRNVDFPLVFLAFLTSWGSPPDPGWWAAEDVESMDAGLPPPDDRRKQAFFENVALAAGILNIFASQTLLLSLLFVRAIRFSTDVFLPDVTPPHLVRWDFAASVYA